MFQKSFWLIGVSFGLLITPLAVFAGDPVPGVDVSLEQQPGGKRYSATADGQGRVTFKQVDPGKYLVVISVPKTIAKSVSVSSGSDGGGIEFSITGAEPPTLSAAGKSSGSKCTAAEVDKAVARQKSAAAGSAVGRVSAKQLSGGPACVAMNVSQKQPITVVLNTIDHNSSRSNVSN